MDALAAYESGSDSENDEAEEVNARTNGPETGKQGTSQVASGKRPATSEGRYGPLCPRVRVCETNFRVFLPGTLGS